MKHTGAEDGDGCDRVDGDGGTEPAFGLGLEDGEAAFGLGLEDGIAEDGDGCDRVDGDGGAEPAFGLGLEDGEGADGEADGAALGPLFEDNCGGAIDVGDADFADGANPPTDEAMLTTDA